MSKIEKDPAESTTVEGLRIQAENIAFDAHEMIACGGCRRMNAPNRMSCMYCGSELEIGSDRLSLVKPNLRKLEEWEPGHNVILTTIVDPSGSGVAAIEKNVGLDVTQVREIVETRRPMPIARVGSAKEAQIILDSLAHDDIVCSIVSDESLMPDRSPVRLRAIEFCDDSVKLVEFNTGKITDIRRTELALIVPGSISETKIDQLEKKRRRGESKVLEEFENASDEATLDMYDRRDSVGYRVMLTGFDFSCLAGDKGLLAVENMRRLTMRLHEFTPNARLVSDYGSLKHALSNIWEIDHRKDSRGLLRSGFARLEFGSSLTSSNLRQLNRYSRLQWHLL